MTKIGVIIPTFNGNEYLLPCLRSILNPLATEDLLHVYVVNNGDARNMKLIDHPRATILQQDKNLGWEGGLKKGLEASQEEFVVFMNDDTFIPMTSLRWANHLIDHFSYPQVAAVGPSSNCVMGVQNIFSDLPHYLGVVRVNFLIGFCVMLRRSALDAVGGVDDTLPGGDDLDLSIRLRKADYVLLHDRQTFVYHHGFATGVRVKGPPEKAGGWNSVEMMEKTNFALIRKHGLPAYLECMNQVPEIPKVQFGPDSKWQEDSEGDFIRSLLTGGQILEVGCGARKTLPTVVGVDRVPKNQPIPGVVLGLLSQADITANAEGPIPVESNSFDAVIARHVLEHIVDSTMAIQEWKRVLKHGGRLIVAVPNHHLRNTIPMNIEHVRAFTPESLKHQMEAMGLKTVDLLDPENCVSFVGVFEKCNGNGAHA